MPFQKITNIVQSFLQAFVSGLTPCPFISQTVFREVIGALAETDRLSRSRYDKGIDSYLSMLDAQRSLYATQQGLVALRLARLANLVKLYMVLGGGWNAE